MILVSSVFSPDAETVSGLSCHSGGAAELLHQRSSLWMDGVASCWTLWGECSFPLYLPPPVLLDIECFLPQDHRAFFDLVCRRSGQPRSLQHLCRCALRLHLGAGFHSGIEHLDIPRSVKEYLLLGNRGTLHWTCSLHICGHFIKYCF